MLVFESILIMLAAVLLSNFINRLIPAFSVPLIQIILGVAISLLKLGSFGPGFVYDPELFFVLFIAPLVFQTSYKEDNKALWILRGPIAGTGFFLVFTTVAIVGLFTHFLIPTIPLAVAFTLISALGPIDVVAVDAVAKRVSIPRKIMSIMNGAALVDDASGIICFQFALIAVTTGGFSLGRASLRFVVVGLGGIVVGLILTGVKYLVVKSLRTLGIKNATLHILIEVMTPFLIYMVGEVLQISGILAVFASGILHSMMRDKFNPETARLNIAKESVWEFLTFSLDGIVFIILGLQLPGILKAASSGTFVKDGLAIAGYVLLLTGAIIVLSFVWWILTIRKKVYQEEGDPISSVKAATIFSLAGARGTVSLAIAMSIPFTLENGEPFPERNLIILLASGIIIISLIITNFVLPLFVRGKGNAEKSVYEQEAYSDIVRGVIDRLASEATEDNMLATRLVIHNYNKRGTVVERKAPRKRQVSQMERELRSQMLIWEKENTRSLLESGDVNQETAERFLNLLDQRTHTGRRKRRLIPLIYLKHISRLFKADTPPMNDDFQTIISLNITYIMQKLDEICNEENAAIIQKLTADLELMRSVNQSRGTHKTAADDDSVYAITVRGFTIERELIQEMFESYRISWDTAKELRADIATLEAQLQNDFA